MPQLPNTGRQIIDPTDLAPLYVGLSAANSHLLSESAPARPAYALSVAPAAGGIGIGIRIGRALACTPTPVYRPTPVRVIEGAVRHDAPMVPGR